MLGRVAATGAFVPFNPAASDGSGVPAAVLYANTDTTLLPRSAVVTARRSQVTGAALIWPAGISATDLEVAVAALARLGIDVR